MILVVGATGHLGATVCRELATAGYPVRALVRPRSDVRHLAGMGIELCRGDLRNADSVRAACDRVDAVVSTANAGAPADRHTTFPTVEGDGYFNLIRACQRTPIDRFVFLSLPVTPWDDLVPSYRYKRRNENRLHRSGVPFTILRCAPFMDDWLALLGTTIPLRGDRQHVLRRPFWFPRLYMTLAGSLMDPCGLALVPGTGWTRHAFVAVEDVARCVVDALSTSTAADVTVHLGGPEILTWNEAVDAWARTLGRRVRRVPVPSWGYRANQLLVAPFAPAVADWLGRMWIQSLWGTPFQPAEARVLSAERTFTTVERFMQRKASMALA